MNGRDIELVQQSFKKVAAMGEPVAELFYTELFSIDPSLRRMFKTDLTEQRKKLLTALAMVINSLHAPEKVLQPARALALRHLNYGVQPIHYTYVGNALLRTLKKGLGEEFTPELCNAWVEAFRMLAGVMKAAAYPNERTLIEGAA